jgi:thiol-disulfide isomerase/thioredoxin
MSGKSGEKSAGWGTTTLLLVVFALCLGVLLLAPQRSVRANSAVSAGAVGAPQPAGQHVKPQDSAVRDLHSAKDAEALMTQEGARGLLMVHAPWCGHCQNMMPAFEAAAAELKATGGIMARIEASVAGAEFLRKEDIRGFPTIIVLNRKDRYAGGRTQAALAGFVKNM